MMRRRARCLPFGHKSLPSRIASARRAKLTCENRYISWAKPQIPKHHAPFLKGNLFFNFPASFVWRVDIALRLPTNVIVHIKQICRKCVLPLHSPNPSLAYTPTLSGNHLISDTSTDRRSTPVATVASLYRRQCMESNLDFQRFPRTFLVFGSCRK